LYNAALQERRDNYNTWKFDNLGFQFSQLENTVTVIQLDVTKANAPKPKPVNYYTQANQLKEIRAFDTELALLNFSACQDVLRRLDKAFKAFFEDACLQSGRSW
jgi:hypothetical protein